MAVGASAGRWSVLMVTGSRVSPVELAAARPTVLGPGQVSLVVRDGGVLLEVLRGAGVVRLNDLPITGQARLKPGDELKLADTRALVVHDVAVAPPPLRITGPEELSARLDDELLRGRGRPLGLALIATSSLNAPARAALARRVADELVRGGLAATWADFAPDVFAVVLPELSTPELEACFKVLTRAAGPRARVAVAQAPFDGVDRHALVAAALERLTPGATGEVEGPVWSDALMVRLAALAEELAETAAPVLAVGPSGAGRATLLKLAARGPLTEVQAADALRLKRVLASADGAVLVRNIDALSPAALEAALAAAQKRGQRLLATAHTLAHAAPFECVLEVPSLWQRRADVVPLAEAFLDGARARLGRPRLELDQEAREGLLQHAWPGNVRELKNAMLRAARASLRDEVGRDLLPQRQAPSRSEQDLRGALESTERELLLDALARTRWNVTAASTRLGLPRRTVVYRMARLGLKRPARR